MVLPLPVAPNLFNNIKKDFNTYKCNKNSSVINVKYKNCRIKKNSQDFLTGSPCYTCLFYSGALH